MASIWTETAQLPRFTPLMGDHKTDVLIIGSGLTGILCARALQEAGIDYLLVEADRLGSGITKNTTAKITAQHGLVFHKLIKEYGTEKAGIYLRAKLVQGKDDPRAEVFDPGRRMLWPQLGINAFESITNLLQLKTKRCPHMGCALKWNNAERTWDCPCHGSRFEENGELIDGPATDDLKK